MTNLTLNPMEKFILRLFLSETSEQFDSNLGWNLLWIILCQMSAFLSIKNPRLLVLLTAEKYFNANLYYFILGDCFYEGSTFKVSKKYSMSSYRQFDII